MTKQELLEYCDELEGAIDQALDVLQDDDADPEEVNQNAIKILEAYSEGEEGGGEAD